MKSIQTKILAVVIAGLLVITAVVSAIGVTMTHEVMHRDADRILKNATEREAAKINDVLGDVVKSCHIIEHYSTSHLVSANQLRGDAFREEYLKNAKNMFSEIALNTDGILGFYLRLDPSVAGSTAGFYKILDGKSFIDLPVTDLSKYDRSDAQNVGWYYSVVDAGKGIWLDPYYFPGQTAQMITYAEPLYVGGELIGVVGFDLDFAFLLDRVNAISVYEEGHAFLLSTDGETAYNAAEHTPDHSHSEHAESVVVLKNGMFLKTGADYQDIQRDIRPILTKIVLAFVIVLAFAIVYTVLVTQQIVKPLKQLTAAAERFALSTNDADFSQIPIDSKDEIGTLSRVLTNTYSKIQEYTSYINALAYRDSLTGIKNTTAYTEAIESLNKDIRTSSPQFGVLVADINNLKQTNDRYGHDVGNELIVHTSKILVDTFKTSAVFRIGGDEFAVILQHDDYRNYHTLLNKLDKAYAQDFITVLDKSIRVEVARGVALYDASIDRVYEDVFAKADHAMYLNKEASKSAVH